MRRLVMNINLDTMINYCLKCDEIHLDGLNYNEKMAICKDCTKNIKEDKIKNNPPAFYNKNGAYFDF